MQEKTVKIIYTRSVVIAPGVESRAGETAEVSQQQYLILKGLNAVSAALDDHVSADLSTTTSTTLGDRLEERISEQSTVVSGQSTVGSEKKLNKSKFKK